MRLNQKVIIYFISVLLCSELSCRNVNSDSKLDPINYNKPDTDSCSIPFTYQYFLNDFISSHVTDSAHCVGNKFNFGDSISGTFENALNVKFKNISKCDVLKYHFEKEQNQLLEEPYFQSGYYLNYFNRSYLICNIGDRKMNCTRCNSFLFVVDITNRKRIIQYNIGPQAGTNAECIGDYNHDGKLDILRHQNGVDEKLYPFSIGAEGVSVDSIHAIIIKHRGLNPFFNKCL